MKISPRDTWPSLKLSLELLPWSWHFRLWIDEDMTSSFDLDLGPIQIAWFANRPMFHEDEAA